ncbi:MAG: SOS response-associated peptidase [Candidatus Krumholzibacteria bacterium]|nr:SOS response-associated peptidase [Candidatus Krumholzibacteria bacterium]
MCGRIVLKAPAEQVAREFALASVPELVPRYNIAPGQPVAVILAGPNTDRVCRFMRWGLLPAWSTASDRVAPLINARGETAAAKPAFRAAFHERRCLLPIDGFYEWRRQGQRREPFYFTGGDHAGGGRLLALAGLWEHRREDVDQPGETCAILTTQANVVVRPIHDRMPVILPPAAFDRWLLTPPDQAAALQALLVPAEPDVLRAWPVGPQVNRAGSDGPHLIAPRQDETPPQLGLF